MDVGLFLIHAVVGLTIAAHGSQKLFAWFGGGGLDGTAASMNSLGLAPGKRMALLGGLAEFVGGALLALGLLVPVAAALIASNFLVAARTAHAGKGPWVFNGGWEYPLILGTVALGLAFNGAGKWSLDHAIGWDVSGFWWGIGAAAVALIGAAGVLANAHRGSTPSRGPLGTKGRAAGAGPA